MRFYKVIIFILGTLSILSCSDEWHEEQSHKLLIQHNWVLDMYVDGVQNEIVSIGEMKYIFKNDGVFIKEIGSDNFHYSTWEIPQPNYVRIGASTFRIKTLTNRILSLEYGEDVLYFLPDA